MAYLSKHKNLIRIFCFIGGLIIFYFANFAGKFKDNEFFDINEYKSGKHENSNYFYTLDKNNKIDSYIVYSIDICPDIKGYGGHIPIILQTDKQGKILKIKVQDNKETPSYMAYILKAEDFLKKFIGKKDTNKINGIDTISGATSTTKALKSEIIQIVNFIKGL